MSLPKEKLDEIISELDSLNPEELEQIAVMIRNFKIITNSKQKKKPSDFRGIWSHLDINVEQECNKMRKEWDDLYHQISDCRVEQSETSHDD